MKQNVFVWVIVLGFWVMLKVAECATFNLSRKLAEMSQWFLFTKCFVKHCITVYPEPKENDNKFKKRELFSHLGIPVWKISL